jgi:hypothetical protein
MADAQTAGITASKSDIEGKDGSITAYDLTLGSPGDIRNCDALKAAQNVWLRAVSNGHPQGAGAFHRLEGAGEIGTVLMPGEQATRASW